MRSTARLRRPCIAARSHTVDRSGARGVGGTRVRRSRRNHRGRLIAVLALPQRPRIDASFCASERRRRRQPLR